MAGWGREEFIEKYYQKDESVGEAYTLVTEESVERKNCRGKTKNRIYSNIQLRIWVDVNIWR